jgi:ABC-type glycerol-3-phosphate transport system substrate-binding protein
MKKWIALCLAAVMALSLAACGSSASSSSTSAASSASAEEVKDKDLAKIIEEARPEEDNQYMEILAGNLDEAATMPLNPNSLTDEDIQSTADMMFATLGVDLASVSKYALSMSLMNVKAYAIGIFQPISGMEEDVTTELKAYVAAQQNAFENYLEDQYDIAKDAIVRETSDGYVILVMCENSTEVANAIEAALK